MSKEIDLFEIILFTALKFHNCFRSQNLSRKSKFEIEKYILYVIEIKFWNKLKNQNIILKTQIQHIKNNTLWKKNYLKQNPKTYSINGISKNKNLERLFQKGSNPEKCFRNPNL